LPFAPLSAWKNPRKSATLNTPVLGTHDWIAFKGYVLAGRPAFIKSNLNRYFIGTGAPDNGFKPSNAEGAYQDATACHCILFDEDGTVTRDRAELRVRQEFDKAVQALADGDLPLRRSTPEPSPTTWATWVSSTTSWEPIALGV
jgi:hypothetical protein